LINNVDLKVIESHRHGQINGHGAVQDLYGSHNPYLVVAAHEGRQLNIYQECHEIDVMLYKEQKLNSTDFYSNHMIN
jgi:hypothetical protein